MRYLVILMIALSFAGCGDDDIMGCTNPNSDNYNAEATLDDGSCQISGCTDANATNYNASANSDDGSCIFSGCTDPNASNYDPNATVDSGNCLYPGCTDVQSDQYDSDANEDDGSCMTYFERWSSTFTGDFDCEGELLDDFFGDATMTFSKIDNTDYTDSIEVFITFSLSDLPLNFNAFLTRDSVYANSFFENYEYDGDLIPNVDPEIFDVTVSGVLGINDDNTGINGTLIVDVLEKGSGFNITFTDSCTFDGIKE